MSAGREERVLPSTWELILEYCPENEVEEVKRILGTSLVEQAADLHDEVSINVMLSSMISSIVM